MSKFVMVEVSGATKEEALSKAPFSVTSDVTVSHRRFCEQYDRPVNKQELTQFMLDILENKTKCKEGLGLCITCEHSIQNKKEYPFSIKEVFNKKGIRKYKTVYQIYENLGTEENPVKGKLLAECNETKAYSKKLAKDLYKSGFNGKLMCVYTKQVQNGEPIAWISDFKPSKNTKEGVYLCFGFVED